MQSLGRLECDVEKTWRAGVDPSPLSLTSISILTAPICKRTRTHTHTHLRARTHTHTLTLPLSPARSSSQVLCLALSISLSFSLFLSLILLSLARTARPAHTYKTANSAGGRRGARARPTAKHTQARPAPPRRSASGARRGRPCRACGTVRSHGEASRCPLDKPPVLDYRR